METAENRPWLFGLLFDNVGMDRSEKSMTIKF